MKEIFLRYRLDLFISAAVCAILGIVLIAWPAETLNVICRTLAVILIIIGITEGLKSHKGSRNPAALLLAVTALFIGIYIFVNPKMMVELVPVVIGVVLLLHGIQNLMTAISIKEAGYERWWIVLAMAVISIILGFVCMCHAFKLVTLTFRIIGILLAYDGISDFWIAFRAVRAMRQKELDEAALESEYKEVE